MKDIVLVTVTKGISVEKINQAIKSGATIIGESRVQEIESKLPYLLECKKHMIGSLQRNKVKKAVDIFDLIQSVDSIKLAKEINQKASAISKKQDILIQLNLGDEINKKGFAIDECEETLDGIKSFDNISVKGLMCVYPYLLDKEKLRVYFKKANRLFLTLKDKYGLETLSMGMSSDYDIAIQEGATMVRIGTKLFEPYD